MLHLKLQTCFICLGLISAILSFQKFPLKLNEFEPENEFKQDTLVSWTCDMALIKSCIVQHANVWDIKATTILLVGSSSTFKYSASGRAETWIENLVSEKYEKKIGKLFCLYFRTFRIFWDSNKILTTFGGHGQIFLCSDRKRVDSLEKYTQIVNLINIFVGI